MAILGRGLALSLFTAIMLTTGLTRGFAQAPSLVSAPAPAGTIHYVSDSVLIEREFPLLSRLLRDPAARSTIEKQPKLRAMLEERVQGIAHSTDSCGKDAQCMLDTVRFTPQQIADGAAALREVYTSDAAVRGFVQREMKPVEMFTLHPELRGADLLVESWQHTAAGMNLILDRYGSGAAPRYPLIDSMSLDKSKPGFALVVRDLLDTASLAEPPIASGRKNTPMLFFEPTLRVSIRLMMANDRDEAGREWPMDTGINAPVIRHAATIAWKDHPYSTIAWKDHPYSVIVVPGAGPDEPGEAISPGGRERVRLAVQAYREKLAPIILVSGGYVHPNQTVFCEALEMRRYLMQVYGLPASAILVDPHARHTTTNVRNAAREVFAYKLPATKPMLIVSDSFQVNSIQSLKFGERNRKELGYEPAALGKRLSPFRLEATPLRASLFVDPTDPLDP